MDIRESSKMIIASRKSNLAQIQTELVIDIIRRKYGLNCEKLLMETEGDLRLDVSLDKIGGKGVFVKDIEILLANNKAHAAVHSMKDVPFALDNIFEIAAIPVREDVRDAFVSGSERNFYELLKGAKVGTSSKRRAAQVKLIRPDIEIVPLRGNIQTRIDKIKRDGMDGIILAAAGLKRLGLQDQISNYFNPLEFIPAVGQGAIGIEVVSSSEYAEFFRKLDCPEVRICVESERSFMRKLNGDCHTAIGAYATLDGSLMNVTGIFQVGNTIIKKDITGPKEDYIRLGEMLAEKIILG